jgi:hypothetical protein
VVASVGPRWCQHTCEREPKQLEVTETMQQWTIVRHPPPGLLVLVAIKQGSSMYSCICATNLTCFGRVGTRSPRIDS